MRWIWIVALAALAGCGSCGEDDVPLQEQDTNVRVEQDTGSGPCGGCVDEEGACVAGDDAAACGVGGSACEACAGEEVCLENRTCGDPPPCGPDVCDGCCDAAGECVAGTAADACGAGGNGCAICGDGTSCGDGVCAEACGPGNCNGCCDSTGSCVGGAEDLACGLGGSSCVDCTANGATCGGIGCVDTSCAATCAGCCAGDVCVMSPDAQQCGAGGNACAACGAGESCLASGACGAAPMSGLWNLILVSATIAPTKPNGSAWDPGQGDPDPTVDIASYDVATDQLFYDYSSVIDDAFSPVWNETVLRNVPTAALLDGVEFYIFDLDTAFDDDICYDVIYPDMAMINGQNITTACVADPRTSWTWRLEPAP